MSNVLNKITKQYLISVNTPDYTESDWLINPVLPTCDSKFWVIEGDTIREMTHEEKDAYLYMYESIVYIIAEKQLITNVDGSEYESNANAIINPVMPNCDVKYTKVVDGTVVEMTLEEQDDIDLIDMRCTKQNLIKEQCTNHILNVYSEHVQLSAAMMIYSSDATDLMREFIAGCIKEENMCFDALEVATTIAEAELVTPTFPEE